MVVDEVGRWMSMDFYGERNDFVRYSESLSDSSLGISASARAINVLIS